MVYQLSRIRMFIAAHSFLLVVVIVVNCYFCTQFLFPFQLQIEFRVEIGLCMQLMYILLSLPVFHCCYYCVPYFPLCPAL